jgi:hypothetical protein
MAKTKTKTKAKAKSTTKQKTATKRSAEVRKKIQTTMEAVEQDHMILAALLAEAYNKKYWEEWGFEDFKVYCADELDVHWRKAYYFVDIWNKVEEYNLDVKQVKEIGWTKMKEIATVMTKRNYKSLMKKAAKMNARDFIDEIKVIRAKQKGKDPAPVVTSINLKANEDEAKTILEAISEAKKLTESANDTVALEMICSDWLEDKGAVPEATPLESKIAFLEKAYGVKLQVVGESEEEEVEEAEEVEEEEEKPKKKATSKKKTTGKKKSTKKKEAKKEEETDQDIDDLLGL